MDLGGNVVEQRMKQVKAARLQARDFGYGIGVVVCDAKVSIRPHHADVFGLNSMAVLFDARLLALVFEQKLLGGVTTVDGCSDAWSVQAFEMVGVDVRQKVKQRFVEMGLIRCKRLAAGASRAAKVTLCDGAAVCEQ